MHALSLQNQMSFPVFTVKDSSICAAVLQHMKSKCTLVINNTASRASNTELSLAMEGKCLVHGEEQNESWFTSRMAHTSFAGM